MRILFYLILVAGIGNTVLRPEIENPLTLYRLVAPIGLAALFALRPMMVMHWLGVFALFLAYNFVLATAYSSDYSQFLPSVVHYLYLFILLVLMVDLKWRHPHFDAQFLRFVQAFYFFLLLNLLFEFVIGATLYPNLAPDEADESSLRAFFWNQNDLAVVLCVVAWFALALDRFRGSKRIFVVLITVLVLYYNDSKAALISLLFFTLPVYAILRICAAVRIDPRVWFTLFGSIFAVTVAMLVAVSDVAIAFANDTYTVGDLLVQPVINIVSLQASGEEWGSLNNRTDAAIFNIIEYVRTWGFGLGAGGSWLVLTLPQYQLGGAQSVHNALLQFVVDFGYPFLLGYLYLLYWALRRLFTHRIPESARLKVIAILSFPMLGLSQSGAIVTNYFFFASVYFIWMIGRKVPLERVARRRVVRQAPPAAATGTVA
jgi:hypothetical protein